LKLKTNEHIPNPDHYLSFTNTPDDFADTSRKDFGFCWGFSATLDDFHNLAFFDLENITGQNVPEVGTIEWKRFYKKIINEISKYQRATIVPGFKNLREFAEHPAFKNYFKKKVALKWSKLALKIPNVSHLLLDGRPMKKRQIERLIERIDRKLLTSQSPRIIFSAYKHASWSHVLNVYKKEIMPDQTIRLYVYETNYKPENVKKDSQYFEIRPNLEIHYPPMLEGRLKQSRVGKMSFAHEENKDANRYTKQMTMFCREISKCQVAN
jgi:hypothetical protein